jgi:hypothetical protein
MLQQGSEWLARVNESKNGTLVTYTRGGQSIEDMPVVLGRNTPTQLQIADGKVTTQEDLQDFHIRPVRVDFGDGPVDPQRGDRITLEDGRVYEVSDRLGLACVEPLDHYRSVLRVRTTRVPS